MEGKFHKGDPSIECTVPVFLGAVFLKNVRFIRLKGVPFGQSNIFQLPTLGSIIWNSNGPAKRDFRLSMKASCSSSCTGSAGVPARSEPGTEAWPTENGEL